MKQYGKIIIPYGVFPEKHEMETANFFAGLGKNVEFIKPSVIKGMRNPDVKMDGCIWEIKSPCGKGKGTIERIYKKAYEQSENIIFDLRRIDMYENKAISKINQQFNLRRGKVRKIIIIMKNAKILEYNRNSI